MYILFTKLKKSGYGCFIGNTFSGALGYADDVTPIAPSLQSLINHSIDAFSHTKYGNVNQMVLRNIPRVGILLYAE